MIYLIGSMRNKLIPLVGKALREVFTLEVFDDWYSPGENADPCWKEYEGLRGRSYVEALNGHHAQHVFEFDKQHLDRADGVVLVMPAGRSAHLELGYSLGKGKPGFVLLDGNPERFDVMLRFATAICPTLGDLVTEIKTTFPGKVR